MVSNRFLLEKQEIQHKGFGIGEQA